MYCQYSKLGTKCLSTTNAITSNEKFFDISNPVYKTLVTKLQTFPSFDEIKNQKDCNCKDCNHQNLGK